MFLCHPIVISHYPNFWLVIIIHSPGSSHKETSQKHQWKWKTLLITMGVQMLSSYFIYVSAINILVGGFNPSEKYESVGMMIQFPTASGKS